MVGLVEAGILQASAHTGGKANDGYVGDKSGHLVMDSRGECVRTRHWTPALAIPECEGGKKAAALSRSRRQLPSQRRNASPSTR